MKHILFILFLIPIALNAQTGTDPCYSTFRNQGLGYMGDRDYGEAISQFVAALVTCKGVPTDNDLSRLIEESKSKWAKDLQASVVEAKDLYEKAKAAKELAENAKVKEVAARQLAEANEQKAYKRGVRAESFRLALLADMARQKGRKTDALLLSWMGLQMSDTVQPYVMRAFGEAVRDTFSTSFFSSPDEIVAAEYLNGAENLLIQTKAPAFFLVHLGTPVAVTQLPRQIKQVKASTQGNYVVAWGDNANALIINTNGKTEATLSGHTENIRAAVFSPDGQSVLTCSRDNTARLWDLKGTIRAVLQGHTGNVQECAFSADGTRMLTRSSDGSARVWTLDGSLLQTISDPDNFVVKAFFTAQNAVVAQLSNNKVKIWNKDASSGAALSELPLKQLQINHKGSFTAAQTGAKNLQLWKAGGIPGFLLSHSADLKGFNFTEDGQHVITWTVDHTLRLWDMEGMLLATCRGHRGQILAAQYDPARKLLLSTSADGTSKLWDLSGNMIAEWQPGTKKPAKSLFSPNGEQVLSIGDGGQSAALSPLPQVVYANADRKALLKSEPLQKVKRDYDIQFLEAIETK